MDGPKRSGTLGTEPALPPPRSATPSSVSSQRPGRRQPKRQKVRPPEVSNDRVPYIYSLQVPSGEVNVFTLTPALEAMARLVNEANHTLHPGAPDIVARVRPFRKGSLLTELIFTAPGWGPMMVQYGHTAAPYIRSVLERLGFVKSAYNGVLKVIEALKQPPSKIVRSDDGSYRYFAADVKSPITVQAPVHQLIQNTYITNHVYDALAAPLEREPDIEAVILKPKRKGELPLKVGKKQIAAIKEFKQKSLPKPSNEVENTTVEYLHPKRGAFDADGKRWSFHRGREVVHANIKDETFLDRYRRGQVRLHHTDVLKVRMKQHQKVRNGKISTSYDIVEVLDYTQGEREERLKDR